MLDGGVLVGREAGVYRIVVIHCNAALPAVRVIDAAVHGDGGQADGPALDADAAARAHVAFPP